MSLIVLTMMKTQNTNPANTQFGPHTGPIWELHVYVGPMSFPHSPHGPHSVFTWGNVGHIAHLGPIRFLLGVMWGPHKNRINAAKSRIDQGKQHSTKYI